MTYSETALRALRPSTREQRIRVEPNLYLRVRANGAKQWAVRQQVTKGEKTKRTLVSIGSFPDVTLARAKAKAIAMTGGAVNANVTVAEAVESFREIRRAELRKATIRTTSYYFDALTAMHGRRKLAALTRGDLVAVAESFRVRGKLPAANRCKSTLHTLLAWAVEEGLLETNVLNGSRCRIGGKETARSRVLSEGEIKWLWNESPSNHRRLFKALLLTGCRIGELRAATWGMVQGTDAPVLQLPPAITKGNKEHSVPLTKLALTVLGERGKPDEKIFRMSGNSTVHAALDRTGVTFTPHDIRRTVATLLSKLGVAPHVIERVLAHAPDRLVAIYHRYDYAPEMRAALQVLAEWVGSVTCE